MYMGLYLGKTVGSWFGALIPGVVVEILDTDTDSGQGGLPWKEYQQQYPQYQPKTKKKIRLTVTLGKISWQTEAPITDARYDNLVQVRAMFRSMSVSIIEVFGRLNNAIAVKMQPIIRVFRK